MATAVVLLLGALLCGHCAAADGYKSEPTDVRPVKQAASVSAEPDKTASDSSGSASADDEPPAVVTGELDFSAIESIAVQEGGRKKPLQSYAYEQIEQLVGRPIFSGTPYLKDAATGDKLYATDLLLSIWFNTRNWRKFPVILVAYLPLQTAIGLPAEEKHFSIERIGQCKRLEELWASSTTKRREGREKEMTELEKEAEIIQQRIEILWTLMNGDEKFALVPHPKNESGTWISLDALAQSFKKIDAIPYYSQAEAKNVFDKYLAVRSSYRARNSADFLKASQEFHASLASLSPTVYPGVESLEREVGYNKLRPFGRAWMFYFVAIVLGLLALKFQGKPLYVAMMSAYLGGLAFQVYGFALRCIIAGQPPVSNMYESVIWVGFGAVFFGLVFEIIYKRRYFALSGAIAGFLCLVLMDILPVVMGNSAMPGFEATVKPLQPVLRDNYWLTVHVLTITLSYAAFMLTCVMGHVTLWKHLVSPGSKVEHHELHQFVYRGIQVGVLLLACGTILGGAWAYKSWGRFWGWDPKETWAFIALMCSLVVLHGRFAGWWSNFGLSVGSVFCFWPIVMAWYGVNFVLGSGMHAYGSGAGGQGIVLTIAGLDLAFTGASIYQYMTYNAKRSVEEESPDDDELPPMPPAITKGDAELLSESDPVNEVRHIGATAGE